MTVTVTVTVTAMRTAPWNLTLGATPRPGGVRFRVWTPAARRVDVLVRRGGADEVHALAADGDGHHAGVVAGAGPGTRCRYRVDGLRLDATHAIIDDSPTHILREIADAPEPSSNQ